MRAVEVNDYNQTTPQYKRTLRIGALMLFVFTPAVSYFVGVLMLSAGLEEVSVEQDGTFHAERGYFIGIEYPPTNTVYNLYFSDCTIKFGDKTIHKDIQQSKQTDLVGMWPVEITGTYSVTCTNSAGNISLPSHVLVGNIGKVRMAGSSEDAVLGIRIGATISSFIILAIGFTQYLKYRRRKKLESKNDFYQRYSSTTIEPF